jgi:hypothetical protein
MIFYMDLGLEFGFWNAHYPEGVLALMMGEA